MPGQAYLRCTNPGCGKLNPVDQETEPGDEYTCIFCGSIFTVPAKNTDDKVDTKKRNRGKKAVQKEHRPENRNLRKPMI